MQNMYLLLWKSPYLGVTFDTGGISLKPSANMDKMRADMGGAACVVSVVSAASALQLPINIVVLAPLCENMPSACALKPGDVVKAMDGQTIQVLINGASNHGESACALPSTHIH